MKSTGVVRRIDELGRIVIPKEIRRNLKIRDGENMEIFVDKDLIILKKYSKMDNAIAYSNKIIDVVNRITDFNLLITDRNHVIASSLNKDINGKTIANELIEILDARKTVKSEDKETIKITKEYNHEGHFIVLPIISSADSIGLVIGLSEKKLDASMMLLIQFITSFISDELEV